jgi:hypothetical protein
MKATRFTITALMLALLFGALPYQQASAQSSEVKAARQTALRVAANDDTNVQAAILSILDLTKTELDDVLSEKKLGAVAAQADAALSADATELFNRLIMYREYVQLVRQQVLRLTADDSLKSIAAGLSAWRKEVYDPAIKQAFDAILVFQGSEVLATTNQRLARVNADIKRLQLTKGLAANQLLPLFESARGHVASATKYHDQARGVLTSNHDRFMRTSYEDVAGAPQPITLRRGTAGDFACLPGTMVNRSVKCEIVFKPMEGGFFVLKNAAGEPAVLAVSDVAQVSGKALVLRPRFPGDEVIGLVFIDVLNAAQPLPHLEEQTLLAPQEQTLGLASVLDSVLTPPSVQSLIKQAIDEVGLAYKDFFAMSKKAQQLIVK